jgi:hypothetical protein
MPNDTTERRDSSCKFAAASVRLGCLIEAGTSTGREQVPIHTVTLV